MERSCGLTNRNRIRGCYGRTSGLPITKSITIKDHCSISGRRAAKAVELTPGDLCCCLEIGAEWTVRFGEPAQKSAEGILGGVLPLKARTVRSGE